MTINEIRVFIIERDFYARQTIASYLSWDRRTRVVGQVGEPHELLAEIKDDPTLERLDAVVLDTGAAANAHGLAALIKLLAHHLPDACILCLADEADLSLVTTAERAGARAFLVREEVGIGLASAIAYAAGQHFVVTRDVADALEDWGDGIVIDYGILPERRIYPRLTHRIEEALLLCVIEGLPAERAAEEMGVSTSTVRSYIKEGYRILEAADDTVYPPSISPAERAFLRYSALEQVEYLPGPLSAAWRPAA